jgi:hypothetical protein
MIGVERREVVAVAAAEAGIFLEQALLDVEAERLRLVVLVARLDLGERELVDLAVGCRARRTASCRGIPASSRAAPPARPPRS